MTAKHVTERLSKESNGFIVVHNEHETALLVNALIDCNYKIDDDDMHDVGIHKCNLEVHTVSFKELRYVDGFCKNLTDWFFKEVNNH